MRLEEKHARKRRGMTSVGGEARRREKGRARENEERG